MTYEQVIRNKKKKKTQIVSTIVNLLFKGLVYVKKRSKKMFMVQHFRVIINFNLFSIVKKNKFFLEHGHPFLLSLMNTILKT